MDDHAKRLSRGDDLLGHLDIGTRGTGIAGGVAIIIGHSIERVTELAAHYENGLVYYRKRLMPADAVPVWELGKPNGLRYTSGVDLQTMWAHFLMPIDVIVSG